MLQILQVKEDILFEFSKGLSFLNKVFPLFFFPITQYVPYLKQMRVEY